jgi:hypothetical protein
MLGDGGSVIRPGGWTPCLAKSGDRLCAIAAVGLPAAKPGDATTDGSPARSACTPAEAADSRSTS